MQRFGPFSLTTNGFLDRGPPDSGWINPCLCGRYHQSAPQAALAPPHNSDAQSD